MAKVIIVALCFLASVIAGPVENPPQRIVGGQITPLAQAPFLASIRRYNTHICAGAIVNQNTILTVAHCLSGQTTSWLSVVVGTNTLSSGGDTHRVSYIIQNPSYDVATGFNDIAIIKLTRSLQYSQFIQPIPLSSSDPMPIEALTLTGWGSTSVNNGNPSNTLQSLDVSNLDVNNCTSAGQTVGVGNICTRASYYAGACYRDDGSLVINARKELVGLAVKISCGNSIPDVHTSVPFYYDWIIQRTYY